MSGEESFELPGDHPVQDGFFGLAWDVFERGVLHASSGAMQTSGRHEQQCFRINYKVSRPRKSEFRAINQPLIADLSTCRILTLYRNDSQRDRVNRERRSGCSWNGTPMKRKR